MKVSFDKLDEAVSLGGDGASFWIDKQTGRVIFIWDDTKSVLENENATIDAEEIEATRQVLIMLGEIESDEKIDEERYLEIESPSSNERWQMMADFTESLDENELRKKLVYALRGKKPFRRFKDALLNNPVIREKWFAFENERLREFIEDWAGSVGIEIDYGPIENANDLIQ